MSSTELWIKFLRTFVIFAVIFGWFFSGWPQLLEFRIQNLEFRIPPEVKEAPAALLNVQEATSTPENATSTLENTTSTLETVTSTPASLISETPAEEAQVEEAQAEEAQVEEASVLSAPPEPQPPALKERKFDKEVRFDKNARHSCSAKNFSVNLSAGDRAIIELELNGLRNDTEDIEIGSLPLGIDITFLNNADYSFSPRRSDSGAVLQITNQPGSQKGNFSIPIIYTSGNSTTICQINVINF